MSKAESVLQALVEYGREELAKCFNASCCIEATAVVIDTLDYANLTGRALAATVNVANKSALDYIDKHGKPGYTYDPPELQAEWKETGAKWISIGYVQTAGGYGGHLVAIAPFRDSQVLIDLTLNQADRPDHGIVIPPIVAVATPEFLAGEESLVVEPAAGVRVWYETQVGRNDYLDTPAWNNRKYREPIVRAIIHHAKELEKVRK